eukprot:UN30319
MEAWKFLQQPGSDEQIKKAFDAVDIDNSGFLTWTEFVFSIMGEKAQNYGVLADMETLGTLLGETATELKLLQESLNESRESAEDRIKRNNALKARLANAGSEYADTMNKLLSGMGLNPEDLMTDEEINKHLTEAFNKFDKDKSGQLGVWEFTQAWMFLGLKGSEDEIQDSFNTV